jgi:hypothetical protein
MVQIPYQQHADSVSISTGTDCIEGGHPMTTTYPDIDIDDIDTYTVDERLQQAEHDAHWIFRTREIDHTAEIRAHFQHYTDAVKTVLADTDDSHIIYTLKTALQRYKRRYFDNYIARLRHRANNPSWAVTGRANLNMRRYNKALGRYDRLLQEAVELTRQMDNAIDRAKRDIRRAREQREREQMAQTPLDIEFVVKTQYITMHGVTERCRTYTHGEYMIARTWGCYRIFRNGKEIHSMKSTDRLNDAKRYVAMLVYNKR